MPDDQAAVSEPLDTLQYGASETPIHGGDSRPWGGLEVCSASV